jgi:hypothetical protein
VKAFQFKKNKKFSGIINWTFLFITVMRKLIDSERKQFSIGVENDCKLEVKAPGLRALTFSSIRDALWHRI